MELAEFGHFLIEAAVEAGFLELEIAQLLFVFEVDVQFDEAGAEGKIVFGVGFGELVAAAGVDGHFEAGDALQTPLGIGQGLDEFGFTQAGGAVFGFIGGEMRAIGIGVVAGKEDGTAGQPGFDGVQRRDAFPFLAAGVRWISGH